MPPSPRDQYCRALHRGPARGWLATLPDKGRFARADTTRARRVSGDFTGLPCAERGPCVEPPSAVARLSAAPGRRRAAVPLPAPVEHPEGTGPGWAWSDGTDAVIPSATKRCSAACSTETAPCASRRPPAVRGWSARVGCRRRRLARGRGRAAAPRGRQRVRPLARSWQGRSGDGVPRQPRRNRSAMWWWAIRQARQRRGGDSAGPHPDQQSVEVANQAYSNSQLAARVRWACDGGELRGFNVSQRGHARALTGQDVAVDPALQPLRWRGAVQGRIWCAAARFQTPQNEGAAWPG